MHLKDKYEAYTLHFQLACKEALVESCGERIRDLEKKMLEALEVRRKMKDKICEALAFEASPETEDRPLIRAAINK